MPAQESNNAVTNLREVIHRENELAAAWNQLKQAKEVATIIFLDLVGSSQYRRIAKAEEGLKKAFIHDVIATKAIEDNDGYVAKWIGDGVLGVFREETIGPAHAFKAVVAGVQAIEAFGRENAKEEQRSWFEEIHTRVGISSGLVHFIEGYNDAEGTAFDPMGGPVDLAARLQSMADSDVIAIDESTFFGHEDGGEQVDGACHTEKKAVQWRDLKLDEIRRTVYVPQNAILFFTNDNKLVASTYDANPPVTTEQLTKNAAEEQRDKSHRQALFATQPIGRNAKGFEREVSVIGVTLKPNIAPLTHPRHDVMQEAQLLKKAMQAAEGSFRSGVAKYDEAEQKLREVVQDGDVWSTDPRHYQAQFRLAQIYHQKRDLAKAMEHITIAKMARGDVPIIWKLAGVIHVEDYLRNRTRCLDRAVTAFTNAKALAQEYLDLGMEQCCSYLLAITYHLRNADGDAAKAVEAVSQPTGASQTMFVKALVPLLEALEQLSQPQKASEALSSLENAREQLATAEESVADASRLSDMDLRLLQNEVEHRIKSAEIQQQ